MINLKKINLNYLLIFLFLLLYLFFILKLFSSENKIIFKINDKAFTTLDYEKRIRIFRFCWK